MNRIKIYKNILWLLLDKVIRIFGGLFVGIWVARYLGPNDYGILNYALSYTSFFVLFVDLGLRQIVIREIVNNSKLTNNLLGTSFVLKVLGSFVSISLISISFLFVDINYTTKLVIFIISIAYIFQTIDVIDYFFQAHVISKYVVFSRNISFVISSIIKIWLIINEYPVTYFAIVSILDILISGLFLIVFYEKIGHKIIKWRFNKVLGLKLLRHSWPLAFSILLITIHTKIDQLMIEDLLNITQVGIYSVAVKLYEAWLFIPAVIISSITPYLVKLKENNKSLYNIRLMHLYSLMFWLGIVVGIIVLIYGKLIIVTLYGNEYINAYESLVINIWIGILISQNLVRGVWMINENLQIYRVYNNFMSIIVNIGLNLICIPKFGISGAAIASLVSIMLGTWIFPFFFKPLRESTLSMLKSIIPVYLINTKENNGQFL